MMYLEDWKYVLRTEAGDVLMFLPFWPSIEIRKLLTRILVLVEINKFIFL